MYPESFQHITIDSGHHCEGRRACFASDVIATYAAIVAQGLSQEGRPLLPLQDENRLALALRECDGGLLALVCLVVRGVSLVPLVEFAVSTDASKTPQLWNYMCRPSPISLGSPTMPAPRQPWIAVRIQVGLLFADLELVGRLGALEQAVAWGYAEHFERSASARCAALH